MIVKYKSDTKRNVLKLGKIYSTDTALKEFCSTTLRDLLYKRGQYWIDLHACGPNRFVPQQSRA